MKYATKSHPQQIKCKGMEKQEHYMLFEYA